MSLRSLAGMVALTPSFLSQVERGLAEPSITSLRKVAEALDVPIFYFLLDTQEFSPVVRRGDRRVLNFPQSHLTYELLTPDLNRNLEIFMARLEPGATTCEEPLSHRGEECTVVLEGEMEIRVGTEVYRLNEGDSIYYFGTIPHKITSVGEKDLVFVSAITPPAF